MSSPRTHRSSDGSPGGPVVDLDEAAAVPDDPDVTIGTLANGLTYYIRENDRPGGRAELRLVVNAGSANEEPDQSGVAHFLEHMLFNGTEQFPENELIDVLRGFGAEFGADINAYTSYDETVYQLTVATDDDVVATGLDVLTQWLSAATLDPTAVEQERGVVLDEWRGSDQTSQGRLFDAIERLFLTGTGYEGRDPIGTSEAIESMTARAAPAVLRPVVPPRQRGPDRRRRHRRRRHRGGDRRALRVAVGACPAGSGPRPHVPARHRTSGRGARRSRPAVGVRRGDVADAGGRTGQCRGLARRAPRRDRVRGDRGSAVVRPQRRRDRLHRGVRRLEQPRQRSRRTQRARRHVARWRAGHAAGDPRRDGASRPPRVRHQRDQSVGRRATDGGRVDVRGPFDRPGPRVRRAVRRQLPHRTRRSPTRRRRSTC